MLTGGVISGLLLLLAGFTCLTTAILLIRNHKFYCSVTKGLVIYLVLLWLWSWLVGRIQFHPSAGYSQEWLEPTTFYSLLLLTVVFLFTSRLAFGLHTTWQRWGIYTLLTILLVVLVERLTPDLFTSRIPAGILLFACWVGSTISTGVNLRDALSRLQKTRERNRFFYWLYAWMLGNLGIFMMFFYLEELGILLCGLGGITAAFSILSSRLPTILEFNRQVLRWILLIVPIMVLCWMGFHLMKFLGTLSPGWEILYSALLTAIILAGCIILFWNRVPQLLNRVIPIPTYNTNRILREYSHGISSITDPHILASVAIGLISEAIEIQRGYIFEVEYEASSEGGVYHLLEIGGMGRNKPEEIWLPADSQITMLFQKERRTLTMDELEISPEFEKLSDTGRAWLTRLGMEVYIPIHSKDEWIGVMGLGPKTSRLAYTEDDLVMVSTLADQMGLALHNTKLLESLLRVNNDYRRAYASMEQSNRNLQQAISQLEKIDQTKSDFISIASHELRTPLTVMRGYNEMLLDEPNLMENTSYSKYLRGIHTGILRLHEILESMLDMANIDARALPLHKVKISIPLFIKNIEDDLLQTLKERHLAFESQGLSNLQMIEADPEALAKVFKNVIGNAIKFTPDGGTITITGIPVSISQPNFTEENIEIIISDTGVGIQPELLEMIFTKFYQTSDLLQHSTGKTKFKGAGPGLGLAIAKGIIEAHGGRIWAESHGYDEESCPGSQFHIILPVK